jgi:ComF family protein
MGIALQTSTAAARRAAAAATAALRWTCHLVVGAVLPPLCPVCREPVASHGGLCPPCWSNLTFITPPYCERLGIPFAYDPGPGVLSLEALADPPAYGRARAAVRFDDVSRKLVHYFKYGDRLDLAPLLGRWMAVAGQPLLAEADALVPVPLHWRRLWLRRFNQSAALAQAVGRESGLPVVFDGLQRVKPTAQQVGLTRAERARNVQGVFAVSEAARTAVTGRRLVLVDDVLTSGATVDACARALLRAGAAGVDVLIFARVVNTGRSPI